MGERATSSGVSYPTASSGRREYYHNSESPLANSMSPTAFVVARNRYGHVLLVRRADSGNWELPGGRVELGESAQIAAVREVKEESGVTVEVTRLAGVYTDPGHVMFYPDTGEARQQFAVCFLASPIAGRPRPDGEETREAAWVPPGRIPHLPIHPSMRMRISHALTEPANPHFD
jgi:ADP-ribose pyrophosphatase YjhB (NUDIX family)